MLAPRGMKSVTNPEFYSYANLEVSYIYRKVPTIIWFLVDVRKLLRYLYTCWVQSYLYVNSYST